MEFGRAKRAIITGLGLFCLVTVPGAQAATPTNSWTNSVSGLWSTDVNWSTGVAPSNNDDLVLITNALTKTVTINAATPVGNLNIQNLFLGGFGASTNTLRLTNTVTVGRELHVFNSLTVTSNGVLIVSNSNLQVDGNLGGDFEIDGDVIVDRGQIVASSTTTTTGIGLVGRGNLTLKAGQIFHNTLSVGGKAGTFTMSGGTNTVNATLSVRTTGTVWMVGGLLAVTNASTRIGDGRASQMIVSNGTVLCSNIVVGTTVGMQGTLTMAGGSVTNNGQFTIGQSANSTGTVWMTGGRLVNTNNVLFVGNSGVGQMIVSNGTALLQQVIVASNATAQGTLRIAGGTNSLGGALLIGLGANATGAVWMTGGLLTVTNDALFIGESGVGQMTISNGTVRNNSTVIGVLTGSSGTLTMAGGTNIATQLSVNRGAAWVTGGLLVATNSSSGVGSSGIGQMAVSNGVAQFRDFFVGGSSGTCGTLTIAGGTTRLASTFVIGSLANSTGDVWIVGGVLAITNDTTTIGRLGVGEMTVSNGTVLASDVIVGALTGSEGTLTAAGGSVTNNGQLAIGQALNSTGTVWVTSGHTVIKGDTFIGAAGVGRLTVSNGTFEAQRVFVVTNATSHGVWTIANGVNNVASNLTIGTFDCASAGAILMNGGELNVTNAGHTAVLEVRSGTFILNAGTVRVDKFVMTNSCAQLVRNGGTLIYGSAVLVTNRDDDGDGIPNGYEQSHGLDPLNSADANLDNDGDGQNNLAEFLEGTDPNSKASAFRIIEISRQSNTIHVVWTAGTGPTNALQRTTGGPGGSYSTNNFITLSTFHASGAPADVTNSINDVNAVTNFPAFYYRVIRVP